MSLDVTWISYAALAVVLYYGGLFALSLRAKRHGGRRHGFGGRRPFFVLVIPAHDEELVIGPTLMSATSVDYEDCLVIVMNDGSTDRTSEVARSFTATTGRVLVVDRAPADAGRGKGAVLNHAFRLVAAMTEDGDPRLGGRTAEDVVVGVLDADGQLERHALVDVARFFEQRRTGGVQIGVRIANAGDGLLTRMQDMEFVGFSAFVQRARDRFGSVGLGGNGQFTRLSALLRLGSEPWTGCLTEDLDLGLSLVEQGWRIRFCSTAFVAQQGLTRLRPLLRQRTRWIQGHYQCWRHIPQVLRSRGQSLRTRLDLCVYLVLVTFVMLVFANLVISAAAWAGVVAVENHFLPFVSDGVLRNVVLEVMAFGPLFTFVLTYQRNATARLEVWEIPAYGFAFALYAYLFVGSTVWAWIRIALRRGSWAKTQRVAARAVA